MGIESKKRSTADHDLTITRSGSPAAETLASVTLTPQGAGRCFDNRSDRERAGARSRYALVTHLPQGRP